jgi:hypothetical protein
LRVVIRENDIQHELALQYFPNAILVRVPQLSRIEEIIHFVLDGKADMTFWDPALVKLYLESKSLPADSLIQK